MATSSLSPATRRLVGWMLVVSGVLLSGGQLLRLWVVGYMWAMAGTGTWGIELLIINSLGLVAAGLLVRYGRRLLRGGRLENGPVNRRIR